MALPMSPPPSRSSSQTSAYRKPATYDPSTSITCITPISPAASPSTSPLTKRAKPTLTLNLSTTLPAPPAATFPTSSTQTPVSTAESELRSIFSACSDESDDGDESDDDENGAMPMTGVRPRGYYRRLWASREPPSMPPSDPPPEIPRRRSTIPSPTFGSRRTNSSPEKAQFQFSPGPNTPAHFPPRRPSRLAMFSRYPPAAPEAPPTGVYPPESPWSDGILSHTSSPTIKIPSDPLLRDLQNLLSAQLQSLSSIFTAPPPPELAIARAERDRLMIKTQKAYFRRTPAEAVKEMHVELREMEERVKVLERKFVQGFLGAMDRFVEGVKEGCMDFMGEAEPEIVEVQVPEQEEEEEFTSAAEWPEEGVETSAQGDVECNASTNPERRFTWTRSSREDYYNDEEEEGDYYGDEDENSHHQSLPPLSPDGELYQSGYTTSPSSSLCESSPIIGARGRLPGSVTVHEACGCQGECDCWNSFLSPSPAMSSFSQQLTTKGGKGNGEEVVDLSLDRKGTELRESVPVVQQIGGVEMTMI